MNKFVFSFSLCFLILPCLFCKPADPLADIPYLGEFGSAACAMLWAVSTILFRVSGKDINPISLNLLKNTIGLILFSLTLLCMGISWFPENMTLGDCLLLVISGAFGLAIADTLYFAGLNRIGAGYSAIVDCSYSLFVIVGSYFYLHETITGPTILALTLIVGAVFIGTWNPKANKTTEEITNNNITTNPKEFRCGVLFGLFSMLFVAAAIVMVKPILNRSDPLWANTIRMAGGVVPLALLGCLPQYSNKIWSCFGRNAPWKASITASFFGNYLAMICWFVGMKYTFASIAGVLNQLSTIFILLFATLFLKEPLTFRKTLAILMGFAGGVIIALYGK